ncbi:MAG: c-type cytochrome biogenesis protein CcmI [Pseudomonadota bacterium]
MWTFWIITAASAAAVGVAIWATLRRGGTVTEAARSDIAVYKDQLKEIERDLARGILTADQAEATRIEVSRRLLAADRAARSDTAEGAPVNSRLAGALVTIVLIGGSTALYLWQGAPGVPDQPLAARIADAEGLRAVRPSQLTIEAQMPPFVQPDLPDEFGELLDRLREAVAQRPDDLQGLTLLARNERRIGNAIAAREAYRQIIEVKGDETTVEDMEALADTMVQAAGGYVSPETEAVLTRIADQAPSNGVAQYYTGLMLLQTGRPDVAFRIWRALFERSAPTDPWVPPIQAQIGDLARLAGVEYVPPVLSGRGPTQEDIDAAADMSIAGRMEMIEGMVATISDRLATEGGPPEDWAMLIRSLGVLGRRDQAFAIWTEAQSVFPDPLVQLPILEAARDAGVAE